MLLRHSSSPTTISSGKSFISLPASQISLIWVIFHVEKFCKEKIRGATMGKLYIDAVETSLVFQQTKESLINFCKKFIVKNFA